MFDDRFDSPLGELIAHGDDAGLRSLTFADDPGAVDAATTGRWSRLRDELDRYFLGEAVEFSTILAPIGTPFRRAVWQALLELQRGTTATYAEIAARVGRPRAARATGAAIAANPIPILIPCHRVVGRDGSLTGYASGLWRKSRLLEIERWTPTSATA